MSLNTFIIILVLFGICCLSQGDVDRPVFPDIFQTELQGIFVKTKEIVELDGDLYYDRTNNRAGYQYTFGGSTSKTIYDFNTNQQISFDGSDCEVDDIPDNPLESFFAFTVDENNTKIIVPPEEIFFFSESEFLTQELSIIPTLIYTGKADFPQYGREKCDVVHVFSKPDVEQPNCRSSQICESTLMTVSVICKDKDGNTEVNHVYNYFRFESGYVDESFFRLPPGIFCNLPSTMEMPHFPPYFSFSFDVITKMKESAKDTAVFSTHREVWYDSENSIIRIDEYDENRLLASSRISDVKADIGFVIISVTSECSVLPINGGMDFAENTRLPQVFFDNETASKAVYNGKRAVHGLDYHVWTLSWTSSMSNAKIVEEIYFLEIVPEGQLSSEEPKQNILRISHVDKYTYETRAETEKFELSALDHISINNFRAYPKEWDAFDVATCFDHTQKRDFLMKLKGPNLVKEGQAYHEILQHLYDKITAVTGVSVLRISELIGIFDGNQLTGAKGSIIDNAKVPGWQKNGQPGMNEIYNRIQKAASQGQLIVFYKEPYSPESNFTVTSVEDLEKTSEPRGNCFSGASLAAASLVLLIIGIAFGIAGYYVFLKKRRSAKDAAILMKNIDEKH